MKYSSKTYTAAAAELERRRDRASQALERRRAEAYAKCPELMALEREISSAGLEVVKAISMGENAKAYIESLAESNLAAQERKKVLLRGAGFPEDFLAIQYTCALCRDWGFVSGRLCDCHSTLLRSLAFAQLSELSPARESGFAQFSLAYYDTATDIELGLSPRTQMSRILSYCQGYAAEFDLSAPSLLFHGETGLGKTHLSLAIAGQVVANGYGVVYGSAQNLLSKLEKERFSYNRERFGETEQTLLDCDLLILDDLGAEFSTQFTVAAIYNLINTRLLKSLPVIISTNLTAEELEQKYSRRIASRILSTYTAFQFLGRDIRQLK